MSRLIAFPTIAAALALSGCYGTKNRGLESVHQPIVSRADYAFDAGIGSQGLAPGEYDRLGGWLASMNTGYGDRIAIDAGGGYLDPAVRDDVARVVSRYGLLLSEGAPITGQVRPGTVRVVVTRSKAVVPGCPDWSRPSQPNFDQHTSSNFGCAGNSNLAAMVAQPDDLVRGRAGDATVDPNLASRAIQTYRTRAPSGQGELKEQRTSDVGGGN